MPLLKSLKKFQARKVVWFKRQQIFTNGAHLDDKSDGRSVFSFEVKSEARFDVRFEAKLEAKSDIRSEVTLEAASEAIFEGSETISEATMEPRIIKTIFATDMNVKIC